MENIPVYKNKSLVDLPGEQWKEIPFTEGYYLVSNYGRVKALARLIVTKTAPNGRLLKEKILTQVLGKSKNAYKGDFTYELYIRYQYEGTKTLAMVRRLVYEAFVMSLTKSKMEGNFVYCIDGDGTNNNAGNLALVSKRELRKKDLKSGRYIPPADLVPKEYLRKNGKKTGLLMRQQVKKYHPDGRLITTYKSHTEAAKKNNVGISTIGMCIKKKVKLVKGFVYRAGDENYAGELKDWQGLFKSVVQYSFSGKKIQQFRCVIDAYRQTGVLEADIRRSARKITRQAGGYVWRFYGDEYNGEYKELVATTKFIQYSLTGKILAEFDSISIAAEQTNTSYEGIKLALAEKINTCNGFVWQYVR